MLDVQTARQIVLQHKLTCFEEIISVINASGRILAQDIYARRSNPTRDISMMDGYAIRREDNQIGRKLTIKGECPAGSVWEGEIEHGEALRVYTGSRVPKGGQKIIMQENTSRQSGGSLVTIEAEQKEDFIRQKGSDYLKDSLLLRKGHKVTARDVGLLVSAGVIWIEVKKKPTVAIIATGNEIAMPGMAHSHGATYNCGAFMVYSLCKMMGAAPSLLPIIKDDEDALITSLKHAQEYDIIITLGGVSVGDYDLVSSSLKKCNFSLAFHKIAMKPGKPLLYGHMGERLFFGLPGNPVAAYVCSIVFLLPAIQKALGTSFDTHFPTTKAFLGKDVGPNGKRLDLMRGTLARDSEGKLIATPLDQQDSAQMYHLSQSDILILRTPHAPKAQKGDPCAIIDLKTVAI